MKDKTLSDQYIIQRGYRVDLRDDGFLILDSKDFEIFAPNQIIIKGKLNGRKNVVLKIFTEEPINSEAPADEIFTMGWDRWEIDDPDERRLTVRLPYNVYKAVKEQAMKSEKSINKIIVDALDDYFEVTWS